MEEENRKSSKGRNKPFTAQGSVAWPVEKALGPLHCDSCRSCEPWDRLSALAAGALGSLFFFLLLLLLFLPGYYPIKLSLKQIHGLRELGVVSMTLLLF